MASSTNLELLIKTLTKKHNDEVQGVLDAKTDEDRANWRNCLQETLSRLNKAKSDLKRLKDETRDQ